MLGWEAGLTAGGEIWTHRQSDRAPAHPTPSSPPRAGAPHALPRKFWAVLHLLRSVLGHAQAPEGHAKFPTAIDGHLQEGLLKIALDVLWRSCMCWGGFVDVFVCVWGASSRVGSSGGEPCLAFAPGRVHLCWIFFLVFSARERSFTFVGEAFRSQDMLVFCAGPRWRLSFM